MTTKTYTVTGKSGANLRALPSGKSEIVTMLPKGADCTVIADFTASNTAGGETTKYLCVKHGGKYLWCAASLLAVKSEKVNYLAKVAEAAKKVYAAVVDVGCRHAGGATTLAEIRKKRVTTCSSSVTASLKLGGVMKSGKLGHTKADGHGGKTKTTGKKAIYGLEYLIPGTYTIVKLFKKYSELPEKYKKAGIVYVQDSNICISAGGGYIYSTNEGHVQVKGGRYVCTRVKSGYPFTSKILYAIVPKS